MRWNLWYSWRKLGILERFLVVVVTFFTIQSVIIIWSSYNTDSFAEYSSLDNNVRLLSAQPTVSPGPCYKNVSVDVGRDVERLLAPVADHPDWAWLVHRIRTQWHVWTPHLQHLHLQHPHLASYTQKRVLVVPGLLIGTDFARNGSVASGGPQGDLVQWADLILALHALGHRVTLLRDIYKAARGIRYDEFSEAFSPGCPSLPYDLVFTDIITIKALPADVIHKTRCLVRVLDAYGTEAMYNNQDYALRHGFLSPYGQLNLPLKHFLTFYPHTPDNRLLGFAVPPAPSSPPRKHNMALLYGKKHDYFTGHEQYIEYLLQYLEVHSTVQNRSTLPAGVQNHGVLSHHDYEQLLRKAKFLVCVGEPLESVGVVEALRHGAIVLNPRFPANSRHARLLQTMGKPTTRQLSSQVPYLESIGPPHVYTISMDNLTEIHAAITNAKQVGGFVPELFTIRNFVARVQWLVGPGPGQGAGCETGGGTVEGVRRIEGRLGESCTAVCRRHGVVCDSSLFSSLTTSMFAGECAGVVSGESILYPARSATARCLQPPSTAAVPGLYSCAGHHPTLHRLCACRKHNTLIDP